MTVFKYDLTGVGPNIQFGKTGGKINWDTDHFESTNDAGTLINHRVIEVSGAEYGFISI